MYVFLIPKRKDFVVFANTAFSSPLYLEAKRKNIEVTTSVSLSSDVFLQPKQKNILIFGIYKNAKQSQKLNETIQKSLVEGLVFLYELDLSHVGMGVLRFTDNVSSSYTVLSFGSKQYFPVPISAEGFDKNSEGSQSRPSVTLSATSVEITSLLISGKGLQGAKLTRIRTLARYLDDGEEPNGNVHFKKESYIIDKIAEWVAGIHVKVELTNILDLESTNVPMQRVSKFYCQKSYRLWNAIDNVFEVGPYDPCPYVGDFFYTADEQIATHPQQDICGKTITSCALRFGRYAVLPFGGFPGTAPRGR